MKITTHINDMRDVCTNLGFGMLGMGFLPHHEFAEIPQNAETPLHDYAWLYATKF